LTCGERISWLRKAKNLHQREVADELVINLTYLGKIENDTLETDVFTSEERVRKIIKALPEQPLIDLIREAVPRRVFCRVLWPDSMVSRGPPPVQSGQVRFSCRAWIALHGERFPCKEPFFRKALLDAT
jgi:hypothetical protein